MLCYASYTSAQNIRYAIARNSEIRSNINTKCSDCSEEATGNDGVSRRSATPVIDWSKCMFCKNKTYKKCSQLINITTFEASGNIMKAAERRNDLSMLHIQRSVRSDLIAAEAKYHKSCYSIYILKKDTPSSGNVESAYDISFQEIASEITVGIREGKAYEMTSLIARYHEILKSKGVETETYTKQRLKARLQKHFGDNVVFHQPSVRTKSELLCGSTLMVKDILKAWTDLEKKDQGIESEIFRVANYIRQEISQVNGITTKPLNVADVSLDTVQQLIPESLHLLLRLLLTDDITKLTQINERGTVCKKPNEEYKVLSIAQDVIYCCRKSRVKLPKHVSLAMSVNHLTSSKALILLLNRMSLLFLRRRPRDRYQSRYRITC